MKTYKTDLIGQVKRMLNFLKFPYVEDELRSRLAQISEGTRCRKFSPNQHNLIQSDVIKMLQKHKHGLVISDYTEA